MKSTSFAAVGMKTSYLRRLSFVSIKEIPRDQEKGETDRYLVPPLKEGDASVSVTELAK
jgi:hypothetical protein